MHQARVASALTLYGVLGLHQARAVLAPAVVAQVDDEHAPLVRERVAEPLRPGFWWFSSGHVCDLESSERVVGSRARLLGRRHMYFWLVSTSSFPRAFPAEQMIDAVAARVLLWRQAPVKT